MKRQIRAGGRWIIGQIAPTVMESLYEVPALRQQVRELRNEVDKAKRHVLSLEEELQEARRLNRRVAEVTDVVEELLLPAANRDDERLRRLVDKYADSF